MDNQAALNDIIKVLKNPVNKEKPWMTASTLSKRLGAVISNSKIESLLLSQMENQINNGETPSVRYSTLPSINSLEVLWGHTEHVGHRHANSLFRTDEALEFLQIKRQKLKSSVFLSHSFKDFEEIKKIAVYLYLSNIMPWLAETHIQQGDHINMEVIQALKKNEQFLLYLSKNSLDSKWSGKELDYAIDRNKQVIIVMDCNELFLKNMVMAKYCGKNFDFEIPGRASSLFHSIIQEKHPLIKWVVYPSEKWTDFQFKGSQNQIHPYTDLCHQLLQDNSL